MDKRLLKSTLISLNEYSLDTQNAAQTLEKVIVHLREQNHKIHRTQIEEIITYLDRHHLLYYYYDQIDVKPCAIVFAKSAHRSLLEAASLFEMLLATRTYRAAFETNNNFSKEDFDEETYTIVLNTSLLIDGRLNPELIRFVPNIQKESKEEIISETLSILNTDAIEERGPHLQFKNQDRTMISFTNEQLILELFPQKGIPENRDASKNLQSFYKDMLMHEFKKTCPICGIHIPHMLIGSHIKPFRDCAHICEAADHNNGLLLCRNHDFLFDQGYISFTDDGELIISAVLDPSQWEAFHLHDLNTNFLTVNRKKYLDYHRRYILKK